MAFLALSLGAGITGFAQENPPPPPPPAEAPKVNRAEEIIIKRTGDKKEKVTVEINGEDVKINGVPMAEYKGEDVKVSRRKSTVSINGRAPFVTFYDSNGDGNGAFERVLELSGNGAFLGVVTEKTDLGLEINGVTEGSAAEKAGLKIGDVLLKINDTKVEAPFDLTTAMSKLKPEDKVTITYKRDGKEAKTTATLGKRTSDVMAFGDTNLSWSGNDIAELRNLAELRNPTVRRGVRVRTPRRVPTVPGYPEMAEVPLSTWNNAEDAFSYYSFNMGRPRLGLAIQDVEEGKGVKVLSVVEGGVADKAGIKKDDIIVEIDGKELTGVNDAQPMLMHKNIEGSVFKMKVKRNGKTENMEIKIPKKLRTTNL